MPAAPVRAVITGAPGAGKSTLLEALARQGIATFAEGARAILKAPGGMQLRAENPSGFGLQMLKAERAAWSDAPPGVSVYDRGFCDVAAFLHLEGLDVPEAVDQACRSLRYKGPIFLARPWRAIYRPDTERIQSWEEAKASGEAVADAWRAYGYALIDLPFASVEQRVAFVREHFAANIASPSG